MELDFTLLPIHILKSIREEDKYLTAQPPNSPEDPLSPDSSRAHICAEIAMEHYNIENDANYQLVYALHCNDILTWEGTWFHCNFVAKPPKGDMDEQLFFAEILGDTLTVTTCLILEDCKAKATVGCRMCTGVFHPTRGFFRGILETGTSPSPSPYEDEWSNELRRCAKLAIEYYNKENGTDYEVVETLVSKSFLSLGLWLHGNFTAKPLDGDISPKLFFVEMLNVHKCSPINAVEYSWTVNACIILEGKTVDGCNFCRNIFHPMDGFSQGNHKSKRKGLPPVVRCALPEYVKQDTRAEIALEYFNKENGTKFELFETLVSKIFSSDGTWYHCNFAARHDVDGKYTCRIFFAEMFGDFSSYSGMEHWTVTTCLNLEGHKTLDSCALCTNVIHPTSGFLKGADKYEKSITYLNSSVSTCALDFPKKAEKLPNPRHRRAVLALDYYNSKNFTEFELVDALVSNGLLSDGTWFHYNFTAKAPNNESSPKLFFAEMIGVPKYSPVEFTWTVSGCHILEGKTTKGCNLCSEVIHPTHGFLKGLHKLSELPSTPNKMV